MLHLNVMLPPRHAAILSVSAQSGRIEIGTGCARVWPAGHHSFRVGVAVDGLQP